MGKRTHVILCRSHQPQNVDTSPHVPKVVNIMTYRCGEAYILGHINVDYLAFMKTEKLLVYQKFTHKLKIQDINRSLWCKQKYIMNDKLKVYHTIDILTPLFIRHQSITNTNCTSKGCKMFSMCVIKTLL